MRLRLAVPLAALALLTWSGSAVAKPDVGTPRTIITTVGEQDGIRLKSDTARRWHWRWIREPSAKIVHADPPQMLPENDEAVNGVSGRTSVTVTGRKVGRTTGVVGYYSANESKLFTIVRLTIIVS